MERKAERLVTFKGKTWFAVRVKRTWSEFRRNKIGVLGLFISLFFVAMAVFAPIIAPYSPSDIYVGAPLSPPSKEFPFGTDELGRCILSLIIYGSRISLSVGVIAALINISIGTIVGLICGYYRNILSDALMRVTDAFIMIPSLALMVVLAAILGPNIYTIILAIGITTWPTTARTVMSQVLSLKERQYVEAVRAAGGSDFYIIFHCILLNVLPIVFTNMILSIATAVLYEAGLSFLGLGDPTRISWGIILYYANTSGAIISGAWWYVIPPGICIVLLVVAFTFVSHGLDEVLNPRLRRR